MTLTELIPTIKNLNRSNKIKLLQLIINDLAKEEELNLIQGENYPVYSPLNAFEAADTLLNLENFIKPTVHQDNQQNLTLSKIDQPFDETASPFWQIVTESADNIPDDLWETIPEDASENFKEDNLSR
jgi:hypothetical protein